MVVPNFGMKGVLGHVYCTCTHWLPAYLKDIDILLTITFRNRNKCTHHHQNCLECLNPRWPHMVDPRDQSIGLQFPWSRHPKSPQILASKTIMLVVTMQRRLWRNHITCSSKTLVAIDTPQFNYFLIPYWFAYCVESINQWIKLFDKIDVVWYVWYVRSFPQLCFLFWNIFNILRNLLLYFTVSLLTSKLHIVMLSFNPRTCCTYGFILILSSIGITTSLPYKCDTILSWGKTWHDNIF